MAKLEQVPTLFPNETEFEDPIKYLSSPEIQKLGDKYGMVKLKPPSSWNPPFSLDTQNFRFKPRMQKLSELSLLNRIRLIFRDGLENFMKMKKRKLPKTLYFLASSKEKVYYYDLFLQINHFITENYKEIAEETKKHDTNGRNTVYNEIRKYKSFWHNLNISYKLEPENSDIVNFYNQYMKEYCIFLAKKYSTKLAKLAETEYEFNHNPYNDESENESDNESDFDSDSDSEDYYCVLCGVDNDDENTLICDGCNKGFHTYCLTPTVKKIPKNDWYCDDCLVGTGEYGFVTSNTAYSLQEFQKLNDEFKEKYFANLVDPEEKDRFLQLSIEYLCGTEREDEYVDLLEQEFWNKLVNNENSNIKVNYGADIHNLKPGQISGFPMNFPYDERNKDDYYMNHSFNLTKLPFANGSLLNHLDEKISGMTIPWLYIGSLFSTFCWHLEDHYMLSANYCHLGDVKKWYCIPESDCHRFELLMKELAPDLFLRQPDLLHQLVTLLSPFDIKKRGISCYYANQKPGEFIITFPKCYHAGFNCGFNVNEAVNFTNNDWLKFGINALDEYKLVKKPPVFDQIQLSFSILYHFLSQPVPGKVFSESEYNMMVLCIAYLEKHASENEQTLAKFRKRFEEEKIPFEYTQMALSEEQFDVKRSGNLNDLYSRSDKSSDKVCCVCNDICCFSWVEVYEKHAKLMPTPEPSPQSAKMGMRKVSNGAKSLVYCLEDFMRFRDNEKLKAKQRCKVRVKLTSDDVTDLNQNVKRKLYELRVNS